MIAVADRHGVVYEWLRQVHDGRMPGLSLKSEAAAKFVPASIVPEGP
jgi:hypothetical protein